MTNVRTGPNCASIGVGPRCVSRREAQLDVGAFPPPPDGRGLVRGQVVHDDEQAVACRAGQRVTVQARWGYWRVPCRSIRVAMTRAARVLTVTRGPPRWPRTRQPPGLREPNQRFVESWPGRLLARTIPICSSLARRTRWRAAGGRAV